ncbi:MAG: methyltransferase domain-containing protein [Firmicutes bacterium]|nr:methyltransferase domain-containing protein [Bacillota bacterium]
MKLNWINPEDFSFNCFLLMDRFQLRYLLNYSGLRSDKTEWKRNMGIALNANSAVKWYLKNKCPECATIVDEIVKNAPVLTDAAEIRKAEIYILASAEDFVIYTKPYLMDTNCDFIRGWDKNRLFEMADFSEKIVLDVGSGSGRLTFAAAEKAKWIYASEPMDNLREYLREKIATKGIKNVRVLDGMADSLPYPDDSFDIVMSGHVVGDDYDSEIAEITRVCKSGGWLLDCPGDSESDIKLNAEMVNRGFEPMYYSGFYGKDVHRYRKQVLK